MRHPLAVLLCVAMLFGCEREERKNVYKPGGEFVQRLDARGRRHLVHDGEGATLAKLRMRGEQIKVYGSEMNALGTVGWTDDKLIVTRRGEKPTAFTERDGADELAGRLRVESVERGWVVFDGATRRLGYFEWLDDGRLALRDDYSAAPRLFAEPDAAEARTPARRAALVVTPPYPAAVVLPFALEADLDALERVALGLWLVAQRPVRDEPGR